MGSAIDLCGDQLCWVHQAYIASRLGPPGLLCTVLSSSLSMSVQMMTESGPLSPQNRIPAVFCGLAFLRQGPGLWMLPGQIRC